MLVATTSTDNQPDNQPNSKPDTIHPAWQAMTTLLADPTNQATYRQRAAIIEPVFAQLFNQFGRDLHLRADHAVSSPRFHGGF